MTAPLPITLKPYGIGGALTGYRVPVVYHEGCELVVVRRACEALGLKWSRRIRGVLALPDIASGVCNLLVETSGRSKLLACLSWRDFFVFALRIKPHMVRSMWVWFRVGELGNEAWINPHLNRDPKIVTAMAPRRPPA